MGDRTRGLAGWTAATVLVSAFLLFQVQPMFSKMILPWFGGGPSVWTTCMLFFQVFLLAGYAYAHGLARLARPRGAGIVHVLLLLAALATLPILPAPAWKPPDSQQPQWRILALLTAHVGLPYLLLAATAPLIQAWYSRATWGRLPYRFYALSNIGSLAALLSYPFLIEPALDTAAQSRLWSCGFGAFAVLSGGWGLLMAFRRFPPLPAQDAAGAEDGACGMPAPLRYALWILLPAFGSLSLLAVTNQICQDVAVVPFLWILPLSLYLLTFILCFDAARWYRRVGNAVTTLVVVSIIASLLVPAKVTPLLRRLGLPDDLPAFIENLALEVGAYLLALFLICMLCHGELVRSKPGPRQLTLFYLLIAAGGALGGLFVALLCPLWFTSFVESDICLLGGALLAAYVLLQEWWRRERRWTSWWGAFLGFPWMIAGDLLQSLRPHRPVEESLARTRRILRTAHVLQSRRHWSTLWSVALPLPILGALLLAAMIPLQDDQSHVLVARRNFYGVLSVLEYGDADSEDWRRTLYNGRIMHGVQLRQPSRRHLPTTYYAPDSGIGLTLVNMAVTEPLRVATVGLGTGTIAAYGQAGDYYCFYEINPQVIDIAREYFTFLADCPADVHVVPGDARLSLEQQEPQDYDVIALDAFSGDAIPVHLLTVEAFATYRRHLAPDGVIAVHTSNRHVNLRPLVALLAAHYQMRVAAVYAEDHDGVADSSSDWLLVTDNKEFLNLPPIARAAEALDEPPAGLRPWTDQFSNLLQSLTVWEDWRDYWSRGDYSAASSARH
ncbi:MAG: fused MFS/spermidine synthase [Pirellulaceae bacterium]|nr:fused MFS/spermidine synthase [Pirellulaceae bacterium]